MKQTLEEQRAYARVVARAWTDDAFRHHLLEDSASALRESGIELPAEVSVRFVEAKADEVVIPLPPAPAQPEAMSPEELEGVAGGISGIGFAIASIIKFKLHTH